MNEELRLCCVALYVVGPVVATFAALQRRLQPFGIASGVKGWPGYIPMLFLPVEWLLPPILLILGIGEIQADLLSLRLAGFVVGLCGAVILVWAAIILGRFLVHEAVILQNHALITIGPYRFIRHPVYTGYLAMLLGTGVASLNVWLPLFWPISLLGIVVQAGSEEKLLERRFGQVYEHYVGQTGQFIPRLWR